jgi:hypothetical protein
MTAVLALAFMAAGSALAEGPKRARPHGLSPSGAYCVTGPIFEQVRPVESIAETDGGAFRKFSQEEALKGYQFSAVSFSYESQPPMPLILDTQEPFPPEVVYMAEQFKPNRTKAWIRVDFNVLAAVTPAPEESAGLAYALYIKEDGGDGTIENPGVMTCGGDDTCGYLDQTYNAPWLVATSKDFVWASVARSDFFRTRCKRKVEVQVHLFPIHELGGNPGLAEVNFGTLILSSGR